MYPDEVHGMVLVDPTHDGDNIGSSTLPELAALRDTVAQARTSRIPPRMPLVLIDALGMKHLPFATSRIRAARATQRISVAADSRTYRSWVDGIPGGRVVATDQSGHNVPQEQPDLVVATIRQVVDEAASRPAEPQP
jgi:pimeloyl-ACP methyl ester carboxylesterase